RAGQRQGLRTSDAGPRVGAEPGVSKQVNVGYETEGPSMNITRRTFLRAAGVALALPWLESRAVAGAAAPRRMVCICTPLSLHPPSFFPEKPGKDYALTPYLDVLQDIRDDFTVMPRLAPPDIDNSHDSIFSFLTAAPHPE